MTEARPEAPAARIGSARERAAFIRAHTAVKPVTHAPSIRLHLADEATTLWGLTEDALAERGLPPPFWAFAWSGGQALARYLTDRPDTVLGRSVADFGAGSGLCAIAACRAGAATVTAIETDRFALAAIRLNTALNRVRVAVRPPDLDRVPEPTPEVVLAGDVFYEARLAAAVLPWLRLCRRAGARVLIGDPRRAYLPKEGLTLLAEYRIEGVGALEDVGVKRTFVFELDG